MLVTKQTLRAAEDTIQRLERELEQAHLSLTVYKDQERELVEALVAARIEARELRSRAENEAGSVIAGARDEAVTIKAEARAQLAAAQNEITRLRVVQRELATSLQQSLATLHSVLSSTGATQPARAVADSVPDQQQVQSLVVAAETSSAPIAPPATDGKGGPFSVTPAVSIPRRDLDPGREPPGRRPPVSVLPSKGREKARALWGHRKSLVRLAAGLAIGAVVLTLAAGGARWWRGSARQAVSIANEPSVVHRDVKNARKAAPANATGGATPGVTAEPRRGTSANLGNSGVKVALEAVRAVWLRVEVDGKQTTARLVRAGEVLNLRGAKNVVIRAGDAGALLIGVNGAAHTAFGRNGEVLTRRIATSSLQPAAAAAPPQASAATATSVKAPASQLPSIALASKSSLLRSSPHAPLPEPTPQVHAQAPVNRAAPGTAAAAQSALRPSPAPVSSSQSPAGAPEGGGEEAAVLRAHEDYFEALRRGDSGRMGRLVADGFSATGAPVADEIGLPYEISLRNASVEVRGVGAVVSGMASQRIRGPDGQSPRDQPLLFSEVWVKRNDQWQLMNVRFVTGSAAR